jgi:hypothetical protein
LGEYEKRASDEARERYDQALEDMEEEIWRERRDRLRLALLAPDIVDAILAGRTDQGLMLQELQQPLPASWETQYALLHPNRPALT